LRLGYGVHVPAGVKDFTDVQTGQTDYGVHPVGTVGCLCGVKLADGKGNHSPLASAEARNKWRSASTPLLLSWRAKERTLHLPLLKILRHGDGVKWR